MKRLRLTPRDNWQQRCQDVGFDYFDLPSSDGSFYWSDEIAYQFTSKEIDLIDDASLELHQMCLEWVGELVARGQYHSSLGLTEYDQGLIEQSWRQLEPSLMGRFDLAYDGQAIKMLEYNADTPTSLLEASVVQWDWLVDRALPDQYNSLHEKLIAQWRAIGNSLPVTANDQIHFVAMREAGREDWGNLEYLMETAFQAGLSVSELALDQMGWQEGSSRFIDALDQPIYACCKLYPWEWLRQDDFAVHLNTSSTRWIEPAWKMLLSNKAMLPLLWQQFPNHPHLLESYFVSDQPKDFATGAWIKKPIYSREGANVSKLEGGKELALSGSMFVDDYHRSGYILQKWFDLPVFDGFRPVLGSWIVGNQTAGMGVREDFNIVTGNDSHFVPHFFE